jgi:hypothetical protein
MMVVFFASRKAALDGLVEISKLTSKPIEEITLPLLFGKLPDSAPSLDAEAERLQYQQILSSVAVLCAQPGLLEMMVLRILSRLESLASSCENGDVDQDSSDSDEATVKKECNAAYAYSLLHSLLSTIRRKVADGHHDVAKHFEHLVPRLFDFFVSGATSTTSNPIKVDVRLLAVAASIIEAITQTLPKESVTFGRRSGFPALTLTDCTTDLGVKSSSRRFLSRRTKEATSPN